jgi:predicted RNase H-like nuclease (RuvC/YqgF family)
MSVAHADAMDRPRYSVLSFGNCGLYFSGGFGILRGNKEVVSFMKEADSNCATVVPSTDNAPAFTVVGNATPKEELERDLQQKREQLLLLRRQQEELEKQKTDLEDLRRKHEEYARGRQEMIEQLTRALVLLDREQVEAQRRVELCISTRQSFREAMEQLHGIRDEEWTSANVRTELSRALGMVENTRAELQRAAARLECLNPKQLDGEEKKDDSTAEFVRYMKLGLAASLPLIIAGTIWLVVSLLVKR